MGPSNLAEQKWAVCGALHHKGRKIVIETLALGVH